MPVSNIIDLQATFDKSLSVPSVRVEDTTDFTQLGENKANCVAVFTITDPTGTVIHQNNDQGNPDIDLSATDISANIELALESSGGLIKGDYIVNYKVVNTTSGEEYTRDLTLNLDYIAPTPSLEVSYSCAESKIISEDKTNYTNFLDTITRSHTLKHPKDPSTGDPVAIDYTVATAKLEKYPIYENGTSTLILSSTFTLDFENRVLVKDFFKTVQPTEIVCAISLKPFYQSIENLKDRYDRKCKVNKSEAEDLARILTRVNTLVGLHTLAQQRGEVDEMAENLVELQEILEDYGCYEESDTSVPTEVTPVVGSASDCCDDLDVEW